MTDHLAAIREAAERILQSIDYTCYSRHCEQEADAKEILRLLDAAEKDSTCRIEFVEVPVDDVFLSLRGIIKTERVPVCSECRWQIKGYTGIEEFCSMCGRRIVKEEEK
jgi:hypothetical protein